MPREVGIQKRRKEIAGEYLRLVSQGRPEDGLRFFSSRCKQHNPFTHGGMKELTEAQLAAAKGLGGDFPEPSFTVKSILSDGEMVAVHTELLGNRSKPADGGLRQVHLFRFDGEKIVEYWDVTQRVTKDMPNAGGAF